MLGNAHSGLYNDRVIYWIKVFIMSNSNRHQEKKKCRARQKAKETNIKSKGLYEG